MKQKVLPHNIFCIYKDFKGRKLYTKSLLSPAESHFGERLVKEGGMTYREWEPKRSKLAATVMNGCQNTGIREGNSVLYLGASHGFTPSYVSDMIGKDGIMFALDFAPEVVRDLVFLAEKRKNIVPILASANHPEEYQGLVSQVDVVFQDIAQRNQAEIFLKNVRLFLKDGGFGLLAIKARSIDIKGKVKDICQAVREEVEKEYMVVDFRDLAPHEKDHYMLIIKKKAPTPGSVAKPKAKDFTHRDRGSRSSFGKSSDRRDSRKSNSGRSQTSGRSRDEKPAYGKKPSFKKYKASTEKKKK